MKNAPVKRCSLLLLLSLSSSAVLASECAPLHQAGYAAVSALAAGIDIDGMQTALTRLQGSVSELGTPCLGAANASGLNAFLPELQQTLTQLTQSSKQRAESLLALEAMQGELPGLSRNIENLARNAVAQKQSAEQVFLITRLLWVSERLSHGALRVSVEFLTIPVQLDSMNRHLSMLKRTLEGLRDGNSELGMAKLSAPEDQAMIAELLTITARINKAVESLAKTAEAFEQFDDQSMELRLGAQRLGSLLSRG